MYRHRGNTAANPRRKRKPAPARMALYIAESIQAKEAAGVSWSMDDYGIADKPDMVAMVTARLG